MPKFLIRGLELQIYYFYSIKFILIYLRKSFKLPLHNARMVGANYVLISL